MSESGGGGDASALAGAARGISMAGDERGRTGGRCLFAEEIFGAM